MGNKKISYPWEMMPSTPTESRQRAYIQNNTQQSNWSIVMTRKRTRLGLVDVLEDADGLDQGLAGLVVDVGGDESKRLDLEILF